MNRKNQGWHDEGIVLSKSLAGVWFAIGF